MLGIVTDEKWKLVNEKNRKMVEEFLEQSTNLSDFTLQQYESGLKIYFYWIYENRDNKNFWEIKSRDYLFYQNWLSKEGLSSSAIKFKRSCVSTFNNYILVYYEDEYPLFKNYINKGIASPPRNLLREKNPLTIAEYEHLCKALEEKEMWQQLAYIKFSFSSGARRGEVRQLTKEMLNIEAKKIIDENGQEKTIHQTGKIRCKGAGKLGKIRTLQYDHNAYEAIQKWLSMRDDDCPYIFVVRESNQPVRQVGLTTFNQWSQAYFEKIIGRRFHPHLLRESRATTLVVEQGKDIEVAKKLLGHNSSETTQLYVIRDDKDDSDGAF